MKEKQMKVTALAPLLQTAYIQGIKRAVVWIMTHNRFITDGVEYYPISSGDLQAFKEGEGLDEIKIS